MADTSFRALFVDDPEAILEAEYKFYLNNNLLCKFLKRSDNSYKVYWVDENELTWDGTDRLPDLYLISSSGQKRNCQHLITHLPDLGKPTLWVKYSERQWILERCSHTSATEGFVLLPLDIKLEEVRNSEQVVIGHRSYYWLQFENTLRIGNNVFKTNSKKIEWIIADHRPDWIQRANFAIVRSKPKVSVYNETGEFISNKLLKWRRKIHFRLERMERPIQPRLVGSTDTGRRRK